MGQRLRLTMTMTCVAMMTVTAGAAQKEPSETTGNSALAFFTAHGDVTIDDFLTRLRPVPLDEHRRAQVLDTLPQHGAIRTGAGDLAKMSLAEDVLAYHGRRGVITFQIIDVAPAFIGLHDRTVILVSPPALALVNKEEFAALVAHEIGHEYVWTEYQLAVRRGDSEHIRELELRCDGLAVLTLRRLGVNPERLVRAVEMLTWYNEQRHLSANRKEYVSRDERRAFIRAVAACPWAGTS
jgi:hypothetical protein